MGNLVKMFLYIYTCVGVCIYVCRHVCVHEYDCLVYSYVHILCLHVVYDCVQRCDDTVSVEMCYIN